MVKIVGFKVGKDKSACYYKIEIPEYDDEKKIILHKGKMYFSINELIEKQIGHYMRLALEKSDFVSVRK